MTRGDAGGRSPILRYIYPMLRLLTSHNLKPRGWSSLSLSHPGPTHAAQTQRSAAWLTIGPHSLETPHCDTARNSPIYPAFAR